MKQKEQNYLSEANSYELENQEEGREDSAHLPLPSTCQVLCTHFTLYICYVI